MTGIHRYGQEVIPSGTLLSTGMSGIDLVIRGMDTGNLNGKGLMLHIENFVDTDRTGNQNNCKSNIKHMRFVCQCVQRVKYDKLF